MINPVNDKIILENNYLKVTYSFKERLLKLDEVFNKSKNETLTFEASDEFKIRFMNGMVITKHVLQLEKYGLSKNKVRFYFEEFEKIKINYVVTLNDEDHFFKTYIEIEMDQSLWDTNKIDTIDTMRLSIQNEITHHNPLNENSIKEMAHFDAFYANLGQPVYFNSFFFGSEFPINFNKIEKQLLFTRKYYGKSLLEYEFHNEKFVSEKTVFGVSVDDNYDSIQQAFYAFLDSIKLKSEMRLQYNSWFDYMKDIDEERIMESFKSINENFTKHDLPILDSFTIDDGWQNQRSLWEINLHKFPNGFKNINQYLKQQGSHLGLWISPVGGYTEAKVMANYLEESNLGSFNYNVVNVADHRYIKGIEKQLVKYVQTYDLNYIKVDGMLTSPLSYSSEYFLGGGYNNMYSYTDTHERYIAIFKKLKSIKPSLWINYTSYINPSPFFLQYVNSLWMQCSEDVDFRLSGSHIDQMLSYRDQKMYEMQVERKFQIPNQHLYNHDPVFGLAINPKLEVSDEDFRKYLYFNLARGLLFNEFYYSYELFNEVKWQYNAEAIKWYLKNIKTLQNAKLVGDVDGVYGYLSQNDNVTIMSIRNASGSIQTFDLDTLANREVFDYISRRSMQLSDALILNPYEMHIFKIDLNKSLKVEKTLLFENHIKLYFNEVLDTQFNVYFNDEKVNYILSEDLLSLTINNVNYKANNEIVINHENGTIIVKKAYQPNGLLLSQNHNYDFEIGFLGKLDFKLDCLVKLDTFNRVLIKQKNNFELLINSFGEIEIKIAHFNIRLSEFKAVVPQVFKLSIMKHPNSSLSIYVDDRLIKKVKVNGLSTITFTKEKLLLANNVTEFKLFEI